MVSSRLKVAVPAAVAVAAFVLTANTALAVEGAPATASVVSAVAADPEELERDLLELRTPQNKMFYTLSSQEAERAVTEHGFRRSSEARGLGLYEKAVPGSVEVHRLRDARRPGSYILVTNKKELKELRENTNDAWDFRYEGVVGHILTQPAAGTVALNRFSKDGDWRAARSTRADLVAAGYRNDGLLGYAPTR
jgi:hypothetical protein